VAARHACGGPVFGRKTPGCPRCDELLAGAAPREAPWAATARRNAAYAEADARARAAHFAPGGPHAAGACGPVCTAFDW
jgi:hypothetical protein